MVPGTETLSQTAAGKEDPRPTGGSCLTHLVLRTLPAWSGIMQGKGGVTLLCGQSQQLSETSHWNKVAGVLPCPC
jgi:hypothetical protein